MIVAGDEFANTIAGALSPAISLASVATVGVVLSKLRKHDAGRIDADELVDKITADNRRVIANGITSRLNYLTRGQHSIEKRLTRVERKIDG